MRIVSFSAPDPFSLPATNEPMNLFNYVPYNKAPVQPQAIQPGEKTIVWMAIGQSTGACNTEGSSIYANDAHFTPSSSKAQNFNVADGAIYPAATPLLGCQGFAGNWNARATQKLIDLGVAARVIVAPGGIGGTRIDQWQPTGGILFPRVAHMVARLASRGLVPDLVTWMQGENDNVNGTSQLAYYNSGLDLIAGLRGLGLTCPIMISQTSFSGAVVSSGVRAAQAALVNNDAGIFAGPDTDTFLGATYRQDGGASPHLTGAGSEVVATAWSEKMALVLAP